VALKPFLYEVAASQAHEVVRIPASSVLAGLLGSAIGARWDAREV